MLDVLRRGAAPLAVATALVLTVVGVDLASQSGQSGRTGQGAAVAPRARVDVVTVKRAAPVSASVRPQPCAASVTACVDRSQHLAWLQRGGRLTYGPVPVALGRPGHRTPVGSFHVAWKAPDWTSTEYGLPMPWSVFFAAGGIAFHAGPLDQRSHGCVHLRARDARYFFDHLDVGDGVQVRR